MSFGKDLWDQIRLVKSFTEQGDATLGTVNDFLKAVSQAELAYAQALTKAIKPIREDMAKKLTDKSSPMFKNFIDLSRPEPIVDKTYFYKTVFDGSSYQAWSNTLLGFEQIANHHQQVHQTIEDSIRKPLKQQRRSLQEFHVKKFEDIEHKRTDLKRLVENLEKIEKSHERSLRDMEAAQLHFEQAKDPSKKMNVERYKNDFEKKSELASEATKERAKALVDVNQAKNYLYDTFLPESLNSVQTEEENVRIDLMQKTLTLLSETVMQLLANVDPAVNAIISYAQKVNAQADTQHFALLMSTKLTPPGDLSLSDTADVDQLKKSILKGVAVQTELETPTLTKNQIQERMKTLEKEITETEKKEKGIESLLNVSQSNDASGLIKYSHDSLKSRKAQLLNKKERMSVMMAQFDPVPVQQENEKTQEPLQEPVEEPTLDPAQEIIVLPLYQVIYDFDGALNSKEMSVKEGDKLYLMTSSEGWSKVRRAHTMEEGWVPESYIEPVN
ncbi:hypothetical protein EDD86DRAFT_197320 [Gorgonomyces haynaldii]|nr:hypothetical protein EDD86DRAFT_197320 [Gorgonomyces haynaldii]